MDLQEFFHNTVSPQTDCSCGDDGEAQTVPLYSLTTGTDLLMSIHAPPLSVVIFLLEAYLDPFPIPVKLTQNSP